MICPEIIELDSGFLTCHMEPFIIFTGFLLNAGSSKIRMKILIGKSVTGTIIKKSIALPFKIPFYIRCMGLLFDTCFNILLCIPNLCPSVMSCNFRSGIRINHRRNTFRRVNIRLSHLFHLLYHTFNKFYFLIGYIVFFIQFFIIPRL